MSIFAEQLALVLLEHGLDIDALGSEPYDIHKESVRRLRVAVRQGTNLVLNSGDLERIRTQVPLNDRDMERLNTAILAEGVSRVLHDYFRMQPSQADQTTRVVYQLLLEHLVEHQSTRPAIFLSHSSRDTAQALQLAVDLRAAGATVWIDLENIEQGDFMTRINEGLSKSNWLVLAVTPAALTSTGVAMEVNAALELVRQREMEGVIPFIIQPFDVKTMPPLWRTLHRYDATIDYQSALKQLLSALKLA